MRLIVCLPASNLVSDSLAEMSLFFFFLEWVDYIYPIHLVLEQCEHEHFRWGCVGTHCGCAGWVLRRVKLSKGLGKTFAQNKAKGVSSQRY